MYKKKKNISADLSALPLNVVPPRTITNASMREIYRAKAWLLPARAEADDHKQFKSLQSTTSMSRL